MKLIKRIVFTIILLICLLSLYANFVHRQIFTARKELVGSLSLKKGISVSFKSDQYILKGNLLAPTDTGRKFPVIIFCVGSGVSSYTADYVKFLDSLFEKNLPMDSVALFYFDKRGIGQSAGDWYKTSFEERADDVKAAADYLKTLSNIDTNKIIVAGHSQGGWIVQICLAKYPNTFAGGISMAGPTFSVRKQIINDYQSRLMCIENLDSARAKSEAEKQVKRDFILTSLFPLKEEWKQLQVIKEFDPAAYLKNIKQPVLFMFGENDALVNPGWCFDELSHIFPTKIPENFSTVVIKGVNHSFKIAPLCYQGPYRQIPFSDDCKQAILSWTRENFLN